MRKTASLGLAAKPRPARGFGTDPERQRTTETQQWILTTSSFSSPPLIAAAGASAQDVYLTQSVFDVTSQDGAMATFVEAFREKYGEDPDIYAGHGYDSLMLLGEATRNIINTLPSEYLKGIRSVEAMAGATAIELRFTEGGDAQKFPRIHWIDGGAARDFQKEMLERRKAIQAEIDALKRQAERLRRQSTSN